MGVCAINNYLYPFKIGSSLCAIDKTRSLMQKRPGFFLRLSQYIFSTHIRSQNFWNDHCSVFLLIIFYNSSDSPAKSQTRPIQCMHKVLFFIRFPTKANTSTSCLEVFEL